MNYDNCGCRSRIADFVRVKRWAGPDGRCCSCGGCSRRSRGGGFRRKLPSHVTWFGPRASIFRVHNNTLIPNPGIAGRLSGSGGGIGTIHTMS